MPINGPLRVLVVDDHAGIRTGIAHLIDAEQPAMRSVGGAGTVSEALAKTLHEQPHVVVLDVNLGGDNGLALIAALRHAAPCEIVVLTSLSDPNVAAHALRLGARACLHKTAPADELLACIADASPLNAPSAVVNTSNVAVEMSCMAGSKNP